MGVNIMLVFGVEDLAGEAEHFEAAFHEPVRAVAPAKASIVWYYPDEPAASGRRSS